MIRARPLHLRFEQAPAMPTTVVAGHAASPREFRPAIPTIQWFPNRARLSTIRLKAGTSVAHLRQSQSPGVAQSRWAWRLAATKAPAAAEPIRQVVRTKAEWILAAAHADFQSNESFAPLASVHKTHSAKFG